MPEPNAPLGQRLGWFALLYAASVGVVAFVAFVLRLWLRAAQ